MAVFVSLDGIVVEILDVFFSFNPNYSPQI